MPLFHQLDFDGTNKKAQHSLEIYNSDISRYDSFTLN